MTTAASSGVSPPPQLLLRRAECEHLFGRAEASPSWCMPRAFVGFTPLAMGCRHDVGLPTCRSSSSTTTPSTCGHVHQPEPHTTGASHLPAHNHTTLCVCACAGPVSYPWCPLHARRTYLRAQHGPARTAPSSSSATAQPPRCNVFWCNPCGGTEPSTPTPTHARPSRLTAHRTLAFFLSHV